MFYIKKQIVELISKPKLPCDPDTTLQDHVACLRSFSDRELKGMPKVRASSGRLPCYFPILSEVLNATVTQPCASKSDYDFTSEEQHIT
jgi:hypothetical protein